MHCRAAVNGGKRKLILRIGSKNFARSFCSSYSSFSSPLSDHDYFIKDIAKAQPPKHLTQLLNIFTARESEKSLSMVTKSRNTKAFFGNL